ncbi:MAG: A24 family peptidase [Peptoniphilaceae bacterium]|nr:A24 family peptidase [Peptoniphilaceae bacterium]MDY3075549.1 A24 family peptidase [Peptoniphilaceae bacterium]
MQASLWAFLEAVFLYFFLQGHTQYARQKGFLFWMQVMIMAGFGYCVSRLSFAPEWAWRWGSLLVLLGTMAISDGEELRIPNFLVLLLLWARLFSVIFVNPSGRMEWLLCVARDAFSGVLGFLFLSVFHWFTRGAISAGDIKAMSAMIFVCGASFAIAIFFIALLSAFFYGGVQILVRGREKTQSIPFAPFLWWGSIWVCWWCFLQVGAEAFLL